MGILFGCQTWPTPSRPLRILDSVLGDQPVPFLFGGMQYDPTGYYSTYSPLLAHSLSGGGTAFTGGGNSGRRATGGAPSDCQWTHHGAADPRFGERRG